MFFTNTGAGNFTDAVINLRPGECIEIEDGKESKLVDEAWKGGWLNKTHGKPDGAKDGVLLAKKPVTVATNAKPKK